MLWEKLKYSKVKVLIRKSPSRNACLSSTDNKAPRQSKQLLDVYTIFRPPCRRPKEVHHHGGTILGSVNFENISLNI